MNKKISGEKTITLLCVIFLVIGVASIIASIIITSSMVRFSGSCVKTQAVVEGVESYTTSSSSSKHGSHKEIHYTTYVTYEYEGIEYKAIQVDNIPKAFLLEKGDYINIYIDSKNPENAKEENYKNDYLVGIVISTVIGVIFTVISIIVFVTFKMRKINSKKLKETGIQITAHVHSIDLNRAVAINGKNPYIVYVSYTNPADGKLYYFKSNNLFQNPNLCIQIGMPVTVYVKPNDMSRYYVDVESIMQNKIVDYT
ncbi:DUF3592 domain-containing protein [Butyrivibrio sp. NC3005]|uniref:DUF3592 domain-containing protein n=1 Tax=Butyrivibrio sp. NC3005 TaxID=1280685 RepID=UPI00040660B9|nr:DUF3592 domain-containing protein [Butyrivibrio sp. NC3005]